MDLDGANYGALNDTTAQPVNNADDSKPRRSRRPPSNARNTHCTPASTRRTLTPQTNHNCYSAARPGAIYAMPVWPEFAKTQKEFRDKHVSYYHQQQQLGTAKGGYHLFSQ